MLSTCIAIVEHFARLLVRECPGLELEDVRGELLVYAVEAEQRWDEGGDASLHTFLYQRLQWRVVNIKRKWVGNVRMQEAEAVFARQQEMLMPIEPADKSFDTLCGEVLGRLRNKSDKAVLELIVNPSPAFLTYVRKCWRERAGRGAVPEDNNTVQTVHYARFLELSRKTVDRAVKRIGRTVQEIIHDTEE